MSTLYEPAIHFINIHYSVGDVNILRDITGSFPLGKITTLVGPSGAGKTTLLKLCNGLITPSSGQIFIHSEPISTSKLIELRRHVGIALQHAPMLKASVYENLALPLELQGKKLSEQEAIHYLDIVGLDKHFYTLSLVTYLVDKGNEYRLRERLSIARKYYCLMKLLQHLILLPYVKLRSSL